MASISLAGHDRLHPSAASPRGAHVATVAENRWLCTDHYRLILNVPRFRASVPGQFVQVDCRDGHGGDVAGGPADSVPREFEWPATPWWPWARMLVDPDLFRPPGVFAAAVFDCRSGGICLMVPRRSILFIGWWGRGLRC